MLPKPASAPALWLGLVDGEGEVIATHAVVLLDCTTSSFGARLADLSALHNSGSAPASHIERGGKAGTIRPGTATAVLEDPFAAGPAERVALKVQGSGRRSIPVRSRSAWAKPQVGQEPRGPRSIPDDERLTEFLYHIGGGATRRARRRSRSKANGRLSANGADRRRVTAIRRGSDERQYRLPRATPRPGNGKVRRRGCGTWCPGVDRSAGNRRRRGRARRCLA